MREKRQRLDLRIPFNSITVRATGDDRRSSWVKIKNPSYSQIEGREELFDELQGRAVAKAAQ